MKMFTDNEGSKILGAVLNTTLKEIMSVLSAESGSLFIFDGEKKELVLDAVYNSGDLSLRGLRQKVGEGISGKVVDIKTPVLVKDIDQDSRFQRNGFNHYHTKSFISIPLFSAAGLIGVVNIADKSNGESFSEQDFNFAVMICKYTCLTIENLLRYNYLKQEKETLDKQKSALEKYASVGKLAAGIVHEVNNPLDGIIRYTNILLHQVDNESIFREYLLEVKKGLYRIANITRSLLEFSRQVNSNTIQVNKYVDVHKIIDESLDALNDKLNGNIKVNKRYKENLARLLDFGLSHVMINIIKNALDAMLEGGVLDIYTDIRDSLLEISFKDSGIGIPHEIRKRIFEPFFSTKGIDKGAGLGLAICNEIINKYEGSIQVESFPGEGSTFIISIPKRYLENAE